jgi:hypothetical protein
MKKLRLVVTVFAGRFNNVKKVENTYPANDFAFKKLNNLIRVYDI